MTTLYRRLEYRFSTWLIHVLGLDNRRTGLESGLSLLAIWWGCWMLQGWNLVLAVLAILLGSIDQLGLHYNRQYLRYSGCLGLVGVWCYTTVFFIVSTSHPIVGAIACYSAFTFAELLCCMRVHIKIPTEETDFLKEVLDK